MPLRSGLVFKRFRLIKLFTQLINDSEEQKSLENRVINKAFCRPTGIRTPTDGTKNQSATVTPWVCFILVMQI